MTCVKGLPMPTESDAKFFLLLIIYPREASRGSWISMKLSYLQGQGIMTSA